MSIRNVDLNSEKWCDLIFEDRNKEYGAYYLRKTSNRRHLLALSIVIVAIILVILLLKIIHFNTTLKSQNYDYEVKAIEISSLIWLEENIKNQVKAEEKPPLEDVAIFTEPVITDDEDIVEDLKELQEINYAPDSIETTSLSGEDTLLSHREIAGLDSEEDSEAALVNENNRGAVFQDGRIDLIRYIYQNINYPQVALQQRIHGRVICSFIVNEDGSISDVNLDQGLYIFLDEEVIRVIRSMPLWRPAMKDGKPIKVKYITPVVFRLN